MFFVKGKREDSLAKLQEQYDALEEDRQFAMAGGRYVDNQEVDEVYGGQGIRDWLKENHLVEKDGQVSFAKDVQCEDDPPTPGM